MLLKRLIKSDWFKIISVLFLVNVVVFWKFYFKGLLPFPGDLLVSFYFPWQGGGFSGFDPFTTYKGVGMADVIRQLIPWKAFIVGQLRSGQLPLWNPYNFSGYSLLANLQSSVFFPGMLLYLILPISWAFSLQVVFFPVIFGIGVFGFLKSLRCSLIASLFGAVVVSNMPYLMFWEEFLVIMQSAVALPYILWLINCYSNKNSRWGLVLISVLLSLSIFGGHIQITIYVYLMVFSYALFKKISTINLLFIFLSSVSLPAIQLVPSFEAYLLSAREGIFSGELFPKMMLPWDHLITILIPDFFGNPATRNFRSSYYEDWQIYIGVSAVVFSFIAVITGYKDRFVRFFVAVCVISLFFACWPFAYVFQILHIPVLSSGMPARLVFLLQFSLGILSSVGLDIWLLHGDKHKKNILFVLITIMGMFFCLWIFYFLNLDADKIMVSLRNSILPTTSFVITAIAITLIYVKPKFYRFFLCVVFFLSIVEYSYLFNKYQPFAPSKFFFPEHPVINFLVNNAKINRYQGDNLAKIEKNFSTYYGIQSSEGYDSIYNRRYGELVNPFNVSRSDVNLDIPGSSWQNSKEKRRIMDILGVKYYLDKQDDPKYVRNYEQFSEHDYNTVWTDNKWAIYERKTALPRVFLTGNYEVIKIKDQIINRIYSDDFSYTNTVLLEKNLDTPVFPDEKSVANIVYYKPNSVLINTSSIQPQLLFLSDNFFPGWKAYVDGKQTEILRADYTFRAVTVPGGNHSVKFIYDPDSLKIGALISFISIVGQLLFLRFRKV